MPAWLNPTNWTTQQKEVVASIVLATATVLVTALKGGDALTAATTELRKLLN